MLCCCCNLHKWIWCHSYTTDLLHGNRARVFLLFQDIQRHVLQTNMLFVLAGCDFGFNYWSTREACLLKEGKLKGLLMGKWNTVFIFVRTTAKLSVIKSVFLRTGSKWPRLLLVPQSPGSSVSLQSQQLDVIAVKINDLHFCTTNNGEPWWQLTMQQSKILKSRSDHLLAVLKEFLVVF